MQTIYFPQLYNHSRKTPASKQIVSRTGSKHPVMNVANDLNDM